MAELAAAKRLGSPIRPLFRRTKSMVAQLMNSSATPSVGSVLWGGLRRTRPISDNFGYDRGKPIDRGYIEDFLEHWSSDVRGRVLEIKSSAYTRRFGGERVAQCDVLDIDAANPEATIIDDLNASTALLEDSYDCIILTQTLQYVFEPRSALRSLYQSLKPGGVLLLTVPGISRAAVDHQNWFWNFTQLAVEKMLREHFPSNELEITSCGNVLSATAFLYGLSRHELRPAELQARDPQYAVVITARARKPLG